MSLNATPSGERTHIGLFGRRNSGKSSLMNAITGQSLAIVSEIQGTTTDPVYKAMELLPLGPVVVIDTPGIDDEGELGRQRVAKSYQVLNKTDIAVVVVDGPSITDEVRELIERIQAKRIPHVIVHNKCDQFDAATATYASHEIAVSAKTGAHINELRELIARIGHADKEKHALVSDLIAPSDTVVLVIPIDAAAPKGRLILPQQQVIRDVLEANAVAVVSKENALSSLFSKLDRAPSMVICDSQVFETVAAQTPDAIRLTSFSILMARYKGTLDSAVQGIRVLDQLNDGDRVLISEGCTHHRQCQDIGTVKLPKWIESYTGKTFDFHFSSGTEFPEDLRPYRLIVHCGGCMLNDREMNDRLRRAEAQGVAMTNYGLVIAHVHGILKRSLSPFPNLSQLL